MVMSRSELVLIDTCIWAGFFNRNQSSERRTVDRLLDDDRAAITGMIVAEVLQGFRRDEHADWVAASLEGLHYLEPVWDDWRVAAKLGRHLVATGHRLPLTDLVIAAIGLRFDCAILATDPHFDSVEGLKRFPLL